MFFLSYKKTLVTLLFRHGKYHAQQQIVQVKLPIWGQMFEINDVVSKRFVKIQNINITNMLLLLLANFENSHIFEEKNSIFDNEAST